MFEECEIEAYKRYDSGEKPMYSRGICDYITAGYGKLDAYGYWEFPLVVNQEDYTIISMKE